MAPTERPRACVGAVAVRDDALLMIQRGSGGSRGRWSLPGGHIEAGETVAEALVREVGEETGLAGLCGPMVGWAEHIGEHAHYLILNFEVTIVDDGEPTPGDDEMDARWVALWEVSELKLTDGLVEFLAEHDIIDVLA
jgi:ADP-ribose pyrophosphatase YjhB (NUDIX family)